MPLRKYSKEAFCQRIAGFYKHLAHVPCVCGWDCAVHSSHIPWMWEIMRHHNLKTQLYSFWIRLLIIFWSMLAPPVSGPHCLARGSRIGSSEKEQENKEWEMELLCGIYFAHQLSGSDESAQNSIHSEHGAEAGTDVSPPVLSNSLIIAITAK